jgi:hypothetical protein
MKIDPAQDYIKKALSSAAGLVVIEVESKTSQKLMEYDEIIFNYLSALISLSADRPVYVIGSENAGLALLQIIGPFIMCLFNNQKDRDIKILLLAKCAQDIAQVK